MFATLSKQLPALLTALLLSVPAVADEDKGTGGAQVDPKPEAAKIVDVVIKATVNEDPAQDNPFGPPQRNFLGKLNLLDEIAADESVAGIRLKVKGVPDMAHTIDLMDRLRRIKSAGKKIVCYTETLGQGSLMFASLADHLAVPPSGMISLEGLLAEVMYMKDLLAMADIKMDVVHIGNYKTAFEEFSRETMSDEQRQVIGILLDQRMEQICQTICENRGIERSALDAGFEAMLLQPSEAKELGLIDACAYEDQFEDQVKDLFGGKVEYDKSYGGKAQEDLEKMLESPFAIFSLLPKLLKPPKKEYRKEPRIAIVYATGAIVSGKSQMGFGGTVTSMGSDTIVEALEEVLKDDWVKAVILRVNSPGGSALASDMIWRATQRVKSKKPIISSMGSVAASGGYWISMGCDRIIAQPSTVTGSIGVVGMLPNLSDLFKRFGVNVEVVGRGPHADELAMLKNGPSPFLMKTIEKSMLEVYGEFIRKGSEGRHMNPQVLETLARGRVWTGAQALDLNLVDELGGLEHSIAVACEMGGGLDPKTTQVAEYPTAPDFMAALEDAFADMASVEAQASHLLETFGYGDLVRLTESLVKKGPAIGPENVQVVLPFAYRMN